MTINSEIHTTLSIKEVTLISTMQYIYVDAMKNKAQDDEFIQMSKNLVNRLGDQLYSYPKNNFILTDKEKKRIEKSNSTMTLLVKKDDVPYKTFVSYTCILKYIKDDLKLTDKDDKELKRYDIFTMSKWERFYYKYLVKL